MQLLLFSVIVLALALDTKANKIKDKTATFKDFLKIPPLLDLWFGLRLTGEPNSSHG